MSVLQTPLFGDSRVAARAGDGVFTIASSTTLTVGDLEMIVSWADSGTHSITTNGGSPGTAWTALAGSPFSGPGVEKCYVWYRILASGDDGGTVITTASSAVGTAAHLATLYTICGSTFDPTTPIDAVGTPNSGTGTTATLGSVTTVTNGAKLQALVGGGDDFGSNLITQTGQTYNERFDNVSTTGDDSKVSMADSTKTTAGATSAGTITLGGSMPWVCVPLAIRPANLAADSAYTSFDAAMAADVPRNWWKFDDTSGTTAVDSGSTPTNGTYNGSPTLGASKALVSGSGTAVTMDGVDDEMSVAVTIPSVFTMESWIDDWPSSSQSILVRDHSGSGGTIAFWVTGFEFQSRINGTTVSAFPAPTSPQDNNRHHLVVQRVGAGLGGVRLWVDGKLIANAVVASLTTASPLHFGRNGTGAAFAAYKQDDAVIYASAISGAKIVAHYEAGTYVSTQTIAPNSAMRTAVANGPSIANATPQSLAPAAASRTAIANGVDLTKAALAIGAAPRTATANGPSIAHSTPQPLLPAAATRTAIAGGPSLTPIHILRPGPAGGTVTSPAVYEITSPVAFAAADYLEIPLDFSGIVGSVQDVEVQLWITTDNINGVEVDLTTEDYLHYMRLFSFVPTSTEQGMGIGATREEAAVFTDSGNAIANEGEEPFVGEWLPDYFGETFATTLSGVTVDQGWFLVLDITGATGNLEYAKITLSEGETLTSPAVAGALTVVGTPPEDAPEGSPEAETPPTPPAFTEAWSSRAMIGTLRPHMVIELRRGRWNRGYRVITNPDEIVDAIIPEEYQAAPWMAWWDPSEDWLELPGVLQANITNNFDQNGLPTASITVENTRLDERTGVGTYPSYHAVERGYLSPERGYVDDDRGIAGGTANEWQGRLARMAQIRIWQGYGEPERNEDDTMPTDGGSNGAWTFIGQIDDIDLDTFPDRAVITARTGQPLTDESLFGWSKSKQLVDPITFGDRLEADTTTQVGYDASASSNDGDAANVLDDSPKTEWISAAHTTMSNTEWVQIRVPAGRYTSAIVDPAFGGMDLYIGVYGQAGSSVDGDSFSGWYGDTEVPGVNGGWEYVRMTNAASGRQFTRSLGHEFQLQDDSVIRIGLRDLSYDAFDDDYKGGIQRLQAIRREITEAVFDKKWILVDDAADVVKVVLRWAGYRDWQVESTGVRMKGHKNYNRSNFLIDIIRDVIDATGYVFYIARPPDGESAGMPVFRRNGSLMEPDLVANVTEDDLLTDITSKEDTESLAYIIRVRGKESNAGVELAGDPARIMATYRPPWGYEPGSGGPDRLGGLIKHELHTDDALTTIEECEVAARMIALYEALASYQTTIVIPGHVGMDLDEQIGVVDSAAAVNSRMWIASYESEFITGRSTRWMVTLNGALLDTYDITTILAQLEAL